LRYSPKHELQTTFEFNLKFELRKRKKRNVEIKEKGEGVLPGPRTSFWPTGGITRAAQASSFHRALTAGPQRSVTARDSRSRPLPRFCLWSVGSSVSASPSTEHRDERAHEPGSLLPSRIPRASRRIKLVPRSFSFPQPSSLREPVTKSPPSQREVERKAALAAVSRTAARGSNGGSGSLVESLGSRATTQAKLFSAWVTGIRRRAVLHHGQPPGGSR
jgi:hypothetical protein